ncbi:MAG: hypothetical protein QOE86_1180 [Solirubrobacteraceae bacterium]|nr:hypothetical protein [Solirubrobacteraceae bacterium]
MRKTAEIHRGDLILVNQRGRLFYAKVIGAGAAGAMTIEPLDPAVRARSVRSAEIVDHWARSHAGERGPALGQISMDSLDGW